MNETKILKKVNEILLRKKTFDDKIKFLCDTIRILALEQADFNIIRKIFEIILKTYETYKTPLPVILPEFMQKTDKITSTYILTVNIINDIYYAEGTEKRLIDF